MPECARRQVLLGKPVVVNGVSLLVASISSTSRNGERVVTAGVSRIEDGLEVRVPPHEGAATGDEEDAPADTQGDDE